MKLQTFAFAILLMVSSALSGKAVQHSYHLNTPGAGSGVFTLDFPEAPFSNAFLDGATGVNGGPGTALLQWTDVVIRMNDLGGFVQVKIEVIDTGGAGEIHSQSFQIVPSTTALGYWNLFLAGAADGKIQELRTTSTTSVPDFGATAGLLTLGIAGLVYARRKVKS